MPITAGVVKITLRYTLMGQRCQTMRTFRPVGAAWLTADAAQGAEAWWNHVKAAWRALSITGSSFTFQSVLFEEVGAGQGFGEYAVPTAEQGGTRAAGTLGQYLPPFNAVGVKFTVGTRATRPGQMRVPGPTEGDNSDGNVSAAFIALVDALADVYDTPITLGAPVALGTLQPLVVTFSADGSIVLEDQDIIGHVTNPVFTSQVSRRPGHGN
jgi:hypothetical protein